MPQPWQAAVVACGERAASRFSRLLVTNEPRQVQAVAQAAHYDPVCGCDGVTYGNPCVAAESGTGYARKGTCDQPGGDCVLEGAVIPNGASGIPAPDGCNTCECADGLLACTEIACPESACVINGEVYPSGSFGVPDPFSCNSCTCNNGEVGGCTRIGCPLPEPCRLGRAIYQHGHGFVSSDGTTRCECVEGSMSCTSIP